jgi:hypothetical protein
MPRAKMPQGKCEYCGEELAKNTVAKHLAACAKRLTVIATAEKKKGAAETLYHLRAENPYLKQFWLDLEVRGSATLKDLDHYLREIWLECCGHMSQFSIGGWGGEEIAKTRRIDQVFNRDVEVTHIYDFGTETETKIKALGTRTGQPTTKHPIALLVRNLMPATPCIDCGALATQLCQECIIEDEVWGALCDEHAETHPHDNYGEPVPLCNSPRMGQCGYEGPAEPPY